MVLVVVGVILMGMVLVGMDTILVMAMLVVSIGDGMYAVVVMIDMGGVLVVVGSVGDVSGDGGSQRGNG